MPAFSVGDEVLFQLHPRGALVRGVVKEVLNDEIRVEDEERWTVRVWPDHPDQWIVRKARGMDLSDEEEDELRRKLYPLTMKEIDLVKLMLDQEDQLRQAVRVMKKVQPQRFRPEKHEKAELAAEPYEPMPIEIPEGW